MNMNFLDTSITIPAFNELLSGWYGVQGNVEVVALEKGLSDMVAKTSAESTSFSSSTKN